MKKPKIKRIPNSFEIIQKEDPDSFYSLMPSWNFSSSDNESWSFEQESVGLLFWDEILPRLRNWEKCRWKDILSDKTHNHPIDVKKLNKCARARLSALHIEAEAIYSLRLNGTHRIYGLINKGVFNILWFDTDHGDNDTCVCRSYLKHT